MKEEELPPLEPEPLDQGDEEEEKSEEEKKKEEESEENKEENEEQQEDQEEEEEEQKEEQEEHEATQNEEISTEPPEGQRKRPLHKHQHRPRRTLRREFHPAGGNDHSRPVGRLARTLTRGNVASGADADALRQHGR